MRAEVERFARKWWSGELGPVGAVLAVAGTPLSWAWAGAARLGRLRWGDGRAATVDGARVVAVGNLAVGGTGKTPVAGWVATELRRAGLSPALLVGAHADDEAALHRSRSSAVPVFSGRDRRASARRAVRSGADVVVLDDGFQHHRLARDLDLVLLAAEDSFPGPVLPTGPYREPVTALGRADIVLVSRRVAPLEASRELALRVEEVTGGPVAGAVHLSADGWLRLDGTASEGPAKDVVAVCAIGRPDAFRTTAERASGVQVELVAFPDHHPYTRADIEGIRRHAGERPIVTTEKDAVKLAAHAGALGDVYVLRETIRWDWGRTEVTGRLRASVQTP